jgi:hypothetical protein
MVGLRDAAAGVALLTASILAPTHASPAADGGAKRELTPRDAIATVRIMENQLALGERVDSGVISPDGKRYLLRLIHGDVEHNSVAMDLMTGRLDSLDSAAHPKLCVRLFTTGLGSLASDFSAEADVVPSNLIYWRNDTQVNFLWSDANAIRQVMSLDVATCKVHLVTHSATDVFSFAFAPDGALLFNAQIPRPDSSQRLWKQGFSINDSTDGWSVLKGNIDGRNNNSVYDSAWFIRSASGLRAIELLGQQVDRTNPYFRDLFLNPSGRLALVDIGIAGIPAGWEQYNSPGLQTLFKTDQSVPGRVPMRYALIDLKTGESRLLWDAPKAPRGQIAWSPDGETLVLAPTYLPFAAKSPLGSSGAAAATLDVCTGQYQILPIDLTSRTVVGTEWLSHNQMEIRSTNEINSDVRTDRLVREGTQWRLASMAIPTRNLGPAIYLETRQSLNRPPQVFAVQSADGESRLVLDPNPRLLEEFKLGRVERLSGTLSNGKQWVGQLIYPADYVSGQRYPLLIQSAYGRVFGEETFALDGQWGLSGMGLGPSVYAAYPGQLLATRNIAVLSLSVIHFSSGATQDDEYQLAFESLAQQLIASGIAHPEKIALAGFSRNGHWVEYALAHSAFPFAGAIAADNYDPSYLQSSLANWRVQDAEMNEAPPFGDGLQKWLTRAVGFNAEHIHTPLLMIGQSDGVPMILAKWEIFSRLRFLKKPVEMYMMPQADIHPSHLPQNPNQIIAIQEHAVDWLDYWLTGREDSDASKLDQYRRWHEFRKSSAVAKP